jgi:acyl-CoA thioester hydrolase
MAKSISVSIEKEVPFYDVDSYRIVWHGNYPKYFEEARCALLEKIGYDYQQMEASGFFFPVIDLNARYVKPLVFKQKVKIRAQLKQWEHKLLIDYLITDKDSGERLTKGSTTQVAVLMPGNVLQFESPQILISQVETFLAKN